MSCVVSVSRLVNYLKKVIDENTNVRNIYVKGEISRVTYHSNGHVYFTLKDASSSIDCTLWKSNVAKLKFKLEEGMKVSVYGSPTIYPTRGSLQFNALSVNMDGQGALYVALEQLKQKLSAQGLFSSEHKKAIPEYPENIAIVSGKSAAGLKDVVSILKRRWPVANLHFYDTLVQGEKASSQIIEALNKADNDHNDVILLVRGGGSIEDLWCFNDENLAHCIYNLDTCIVTGIGHEIDFTIAEMVSDCRASTPSAAAELVTPNIEEIANQLVITRKRIIQNSCYHLNLAQDKLNQYRNLPVFSDQTYLYKDYRQQLTMNIQNLLNEDSNVKRLRLSLNKHQHQLCAIANDVIISNKQIKDNANQQLNHYMSLFRQKLNNELGSKIKQLDALSPLKILDRGYSVTKKDNQVISHVEQVTCQDIIDILVSDGKIQAQVLAKEENHGK